MSDFDEYGSRFKSVRMERRDGIVQLQLHTDGNRLIYDSTVVGELGEAFRAVGDDRENRVVILTGTGDSFWSCYDPMSFADLTPTPQGWDQIIFNGRRALRAFLDIDVPIIAAVNGPAVAHAELPVCADIVLASETAVFADIVHARYGMPPGGGGHVIWPLVLGINRARYFLLTGQVLSAQECLALGVVNEVLEPGALLPRAWELAGQLSSKSYRLGVRQTRAVLRSSIARALDNDFSAGTAQMALSMLGGADGFGAFGQAPPAPESDRIVEDLYTGEAFARFGGEVGADRPSSPEAQARLVGGRSPRAEGSQGR